MRPSMMSTERVEFCRPQDSRACFTHRQVVKPSPRPGIRVAHGGPKADLVRHARHRPCLTVVLGEAYSRVFFCRFQLLFFQLHGLFTTYDIARTCRIAVPDDLQFNSALFTTQCLAALHRFHKPSLLNVEHIMV